MVRWQKYSILIQYPKNYSILSIVGVTDYEMAPLQKWLQYEKLAFYPINLL